jgi:hypothetical protein
MFGLFSRSPECLILEVEMQDAATLSRIHGEAFARAWGDGEFQSLVSQASVFGYLACPEGRARDRAAASCCAARQPGKLKSSPSQVLNEAPARGTWLAVDAQRPFRKPSAAVPRRCFSRSTKPISPPSSSTTGWASSRSANAAPITRKTVQRARRRLSCAAIFVRPAWSVSRPGGDHACGQG